MKQPIVAVNRIAIQFEKLSFPLSLSLSKSTKELVYLVLFRAMLLISLLLLTLFGFIRLQEMLVKFAPKKDSASPPQYSFVAFNPQLLCELSYCIHFLNDAMLVQIGNVVPGLEMRLAFPKAADS